MQRLALLLILLMVSFTCLSQNNQILPDPNLSTKVSEASKVVDTHLVAYNNRDLEGFLAAFHDDVEVSTFPKGVDFTGKEKLKALYGRMFKVLTHLKATVTHREIRGRFVIDTEHVVSKYIVDGEEREHRISAIATYEVVEGKIKRLQFIE